MHRKGVRIAVKSAAQESVNEGKIRMAHSESPLADQYVCYQIERYFIVTLSGYDTVSKGNSEFLEL